MKKTLLSDGTENLFLKIAHDDLSAFQEVFNLYSNRLKRFAIHYVKSNEQAEEVVSDVFVNIWNNRKKLVEVKNANAYLMTATKNQSLSYLNKYHKQEMCSIDSILEKNAVDFFTPETGLEAKELSEIIHVLVELLPPSSRIAFKLIKEEKLKYKEASEILGVSIGTVEVQVLRAMKKIRLGLEGYFHAEETKKSGKNLVKVPIGHILIFFSFFLNPLS